LILSFVLQGLFGFETNEVVQCMYEQPDLVLDHESNTNLFQPPNFYPNQQSSPCLSQLSQVLIFPIIKFFLCRICYFVLTYHEYFTQEPIIQNTYHESVPSNNQMQQVNIYFMVIIWTNPLPRFVVGYPVFMVEN